MRQIITNLSWAYTLYILLYLRVIRVSLNFYFKLYTLIFNINLNHETGLFQCQVV